VRTLSHSPAAIPLPLPAHCSRRSGKGMAAGECGDKEQDSMIYDAYFLASRACGRSIPPSAIFSISFATSSPDSLPSG